MKRTFRLSVVALAAAACQQQKPPVAKAARETVATDTRTNKLSATPRQEPVDSLATEARALLQTRDLAPLWANQTELMKTHPTMEGFYGPPYYRISFCFKDVKRDPTRPNLFHVTGLDRYRKVVTPFIGTITVRTVQPFAKEMVVDADSTAQAYTANGWFEFREDPTTKGAGVYSGKALLDFYIDGKGNLNQALHIFGQANPTKGCGLLFEGSQVINETGQHKNVAFANFYGAVVPQSLTTLGLGNRSEEVNPNLARLGWNVDWENDEWWAKSPKPAPGALVSE